VIAYSASNPFLLGRPLWFARGASTYAVAGAKAPIPLPDGSYDQWMYWLTAWDSAYVRAQEADTTMRRVAANMNLRAGAAPRSVQVSDQAAMAIRFAEVRTGRSYAEAFRRQRARATSDSVRGLFGTMLIAMGDSIYSSAELVRIMLSSDSPEREAAKAQLLRSRRSPPLANDSVAAVVGRHVVNMMFADSTLTSVRTDPRFASWFRIPKSVDTLPRYVIMDSLPASVRARAEELGFAPVADGSKLPAGAPGYFIRLDAIRQRGPFIQVSASHTTLYARGPGRSGGYAGGFTLLLMNGPNGWVVVDGSAWVT
jgi:hypothetical protein